MNYTCIDRYRGSYNKIELYRLKELETGNILDITPAELKLRIKTNTIKVDNLTLSSNNRLVPKGNIKYTDEDNKNKVEVIKLREYSKDKTNFVELLTPDAHIVTLRSIIYNNKLNSGNLNLYTGETKYSVIKDELVNIFKSGNQSDNLLEFFELARHYANRYNYTEKQYITLIHFNLTYVFARLNKNELLELFKPFKFLAYEHNTIDLLNKAYKVDFTNIDLPIIAVTLGTKLYQSFVSNPNRIVDILKAIHINTDSKLEKYNDYICNATVNNLVRIIESR